MSALLFKLLKRGGIVPLNIVQADPFFNDIAGSSDTTMTGRVAVSGGAWTVVGDATKAGKMRSADGIFRMKTSTNGQAPWGHQFTPSLGQNRRISFGYNYSQQGGTLSDLNAPYQYSDQAWILAYQDTTNYTWANVSPASSRLTITKVVANVSTEVCRVLNMPVSGNVVIELTDKIRVYVDGQLRVVDQLFNAVTSSFPDRFWPAGTDAIRTGPTGLRNSFYPLLLAIGWKVEDMDITIADPKQFYGRDPTNKRTITFTGTYTGIPVSWVYRLRRRSTGAVVKNWTAIAVTANAGSWSANIDVATGGPYFLDMGWIDGSNKTHYTASNYFAVGELIGCWGQSNASNQNGVGGTPGYGGNDLIIGFNSNSAYAGSVVRRFMDELTPESRSYQPNMVGLAKSLSDKLGIPVGVFAAGVSAQAIDTLLPGGTHFDNVLAPLVAEVGGYVRHWVWSQGEAEVLSLSAYNTYAANFATLLAGLRSIGGYADAMIFIRTIGKDTGITNDATRTTRSQAARSVMLGLDNGVDIHTGCSSLGCLLSDTIHFAPATGSVVWAYRMGLTIARRGYGAIGYDGRGPLVTSASRSGAVITLEMNLNGAASISGSALTGYAVSNDGFASLLTISSVEIVANKPVITLAGVPSGVCEVRSFREQNYVDSSLAVGNYTTEGITIPIFPIINPITATAV